MVEAVHELEMAALKQGDGFQEERSEPAPIDEANDITFPVDPNIRAKAEAEIKTTKSDLPLVMNDQVAMFINYFSSPRGKATLEHAWQRSGRYNAMIERVLKQEGVPQDLIYLAQAESGFQPLALSRAGARGMWQFMAQSGADLRLAAQLVGRRPPGPGEGDSRRRPPPEGSLQPVWRLVSGDGRLQLGRQHRAACRGAHRLRRFLGALQARRAAAGDAQLRPHHSWP